MFFLTQYVTCQPQSHAYLDQFYLRLAPCQNSGLQESTGYKGISCATKGLCPSYRDQIRSLANLVHQSMHQSGAGSRQSRGKKKIDDVLSAINTSPGWSRKEKLQDYLAKNGGGTSASSVAAVTWIWPLRPSAIWWGLLCLLPAHAGIILEWENFS